MKTINVIISYEVTSPAVLTNVVFKRLNGYCLSHDINEDYFEFFISCSDKDVSWVEDKLAQYV